MTLVLTQSLTAIGPGLTSSFLGVGGKRPYTYAVLPGGAGGTINARSGVYTAPSILVSGPDKSIDTIRVTDNLAATATSTILIGDALLLFCEIIQNQMALANGRVYLWDQKIFQPSDYSLYIAISEIVPKPFGNNITTSTDNSGNLIQHKYVNMQSMLDIDIISRGPEARDRKEEVILALGSTYAEQQMEANSFYIGKISTNFINLSNIDGAAIPYRYKISCMIQYCKNITIPIQYYSTFSGYSVTVG